MGQEWNALSLLALFNEDTLSISCVGWAPSKGRRCWERIAQSNISDAKQMLARLPQVAQGDEQILQDTLQKLAMKLLCRRNHQNQYCTVATNWFNIINSHIKRNTASRSSVSARPSNGTSSQGDTRPAQGRTVDDPCQEEDAEEERFGEAKRRAEAREQADAAERRRKAELRAKAREQAAAEERRREAERYKQEQEAQQERSRRRAEEARKQAAEEERRREEERKAEQQRRQEQKARQERQRAQQEHEHTQRQTRAQTARMRAERERQEWKEIWSRYERDWDKLKTMDDIDSFDEDVRDTIPWPVKSGRWEDVDDAAITDFFRHGPDDVFEDPLAFKKFIKRQLKIWHTDKILQRFMGCKGLPDMERSLKLVAQILVGLIR
ncbi:hypothetical protein AMS68_000779 [Peltaster fructicola]|uniref:Uncharacterized protein n=1 Tax=Peltaster fructicola TaxID=286661 RepID=A0A6H0XKK2_9PEZI|nr:hypothetical protein AMS68_000779 [Peltaster fructicola]